MRMKPFNLEAFMAGHPAMTRDGRKAKFTGYDEDSCSVGYLVSNVCYICARDGLRNPPSLYAKYPDLRETDLDLVGMWEGEETPDNVNHPEHYTTGAIECIDAIRAALTVEEFRGYCKGNTLKYVWRERYKGQNESLAKAVWYMNKLLEGIENE